MNKLLHINLGGVPFAIDEDAYERLSAYLDRLHRHFRAQDGYEEITSDIEARLAELFRESMGMRQIVSLEDVESAIAVMGQPEEFSGEEAGEKTSDSHGSHYSYRTGRRLFRDPDNTVVAGVASGVSAYFGINDPVWIRVLFVIVALGGGLGLPVYIILWIIMPKAETAADFLAMRGEPINVESISRVIRKEFNNLSEKMADIGDELASTGRNRR